MTDYSTSSPDRPMETTSKEQYRAAVDAAQQQAAEAAQAAATVMSLGALFGFISLGLGAAAGWLGGSAGIVAPTMTPGVASRRRF